MDQATSQLRSELARRDKQLSEVSSMLVREQTGREAQAREVRALQAKLRDAEAALKLQQTLLHEQIMANQAANQPASRATNAQGGPQPNPPQPRAR